MSQAYKIEQRDGLNIMTCPSIIDFTSDLEEETKVWKDLNQSVVIDFKGVLKFKEKAYRPFVILHRQLKAAGHKLYAMNLSPEINLQLNQGGLSATFLFIKSLDEAKSPQGPLPPPRPSVDVKFLNAFIEAAESVLSTQCQVAMKGGRPFLKKPTDVFTMEIAGVINLTNPAFAGSISLCFSGEVFLKIYESMVGEKHSAITAEVEDAAGEILNMIFGQAKTNLNDNLGYTLEKAIPTIMTGEKLSLRQQGVAPVIILPFESNAGNFHMEILVDTI